MSNLEVVKPVVVDGIEFYVSNDGKRTGVSISGLARLCGVERQGISQNVVNPLNTGATKKAPKSLEALQDKVFSPQLEGSDGAKVIDSAAAAEIIAYYAYESKAANDVARYSLKKFATIGIDTWIKQITGYAEAQDNGQVLDLLRQLMTKVESLETKVESYNNIRKVTVNVFPGLDNMLDDMAEGKALAPASDLVTAKEWLEAKGISLDKSMFHRFTNLVSETYRTMTKQEPRKVSRNNGNGKWTNKYNAFSSDELPILEASLKKLLA